MISHRAAAGTEKAFTLVELLVVIGIISLLASMLLATVSSARRGADRVKCMASLQEIGRAYVLYANDNHGYWPMAVHQWTATTAPFPREKHWDHFISKYLVGQSINFDGDDPNHSELAIKNKSNVLWGCPTWDRVGATSAAYDSDLNNGYAMNLYTFAPDTTGMVGSYANWVYRTVTGSVNNMNGWYYHANQWSRPSERALVFDSINSVCAVQVTWPWWTPATNPMPAVPSTLSFTPDFTRHAKSRKGNLETAATLNMLFCDTHVETVSARQAAHAIRFN